MGVIVTCWGIFLGFHHIAFDLSRSWQNHRPRPGVHGIWTDSMWRPLLGRVFSLIHRLSIRAIYKLGFPPLRPHRRGNAPLHAVTVWPSTPLPTKERLLGRDFFDFIILYSAVLDHDSLIHAPCPGPYRIPFSPLRV